MNKLQTSAFRMFCTEKWFEHRDEILDWTGKPADYDSDYYFRKHRWLLKRMFKDQFLEENHLKLQKEVKRGLKKGNI